MVVDEPWNPFSSREDFEFTKIVQDAKLNRNQTDSLIKLIQRCQEPDAQGPFTMKNHNDLDRALDRSSQLLTQVATL